MFSGVGLFILLDSNLFLFFLETNIAAVIQGSTGDFFFDKLALTRGNDFLKHSDNVYSKVSQKSELWENYLTELNNF